MKTPQIITTLIRQVAIAAVSVVSLFAAGAAGAQSVSVGQALYATDCAGCHGATPSTGTRRVQLGTTAVVLRNAINSFPAMSGIALTDAQLADVAAFIAGGSSATTGATATTPPPVMVSPIAQGKGMYDAMCVSCHGDVSLGQGYRDIYETSSGASILRAIARKRAMQHLNFVTLDQASLIAAYIGNPRGASTSGTAGVASDAMSTGGDEGGSSTYKAGNGTSVYGNALPVGGCTLGRLDQPTDPLWVLMLLGAAVALIRRRRI